MIETRKSGRKSILLCLVFKEGRKGTPDFVKTGKHPQNTLNTNSISAHVPLLITLMKGWT